MPNEANQNNPSLEIISSYWPRGYKRVIFVGVFCLTTGGGVLLAEAICTQGEMVLNKIERISLTLVALIGLYGRSFLWGETREMAAELFRDWEYWSIGEVFVRALFTGLTASCFPSSAYVLIDIYIFEYILAYISDFLVSGLLMIALIPVATLFSIITPEAIGEQASKMPV